MCYKTIEMIKGLPYVCHYKPRLVFFTPFFTVANIVNSFKSRAAYKGTSTEIKILPSCKYSALPETEIKPPMNESFKDALILMSSSLSKKDLYILKSFFTFVTSPVWRLSSTVLGVNNSKSKSCKAISYDTINMFAFCVITF